MVYIISNPAWVGHYKVGVATSWKKRLNSYQTSSPFRDYKLEWGITTPDWKRIEKMLHGRWIGSHEWVQADLGEIICKLKEFCTNKD